MIIWYPFKRNGSRKSRDSEVKYNGSLSKEVTNPVKVNLCFPRENHNRYAKRTQAKSAMRVFNSKWRYEQKPWSFAFLRLRRTWSFHVQVVLQRTSKNCTKIFNARARTLLFCNSKTRSVIIQVITDDRAAGVWFVYHEYDYRPNWTTRSLITS